ncbi:sulfite exporter TauE/SafE family protein [Methanoregula sp.]|uniref:sulfite exporter TauE/SafE family protein n=1 Tax=Methanoregula sp. TaxID=2052170 RepID=UPI0023746D6E|nr:sulfite exporter TauE/SafE family protein [Methanoregula sp.]MDD1686130.1 sulfite exporter TauE/SafE family protein [Methanoregula sp.]
MDPLVQFVCLFFTGICAGTASGLFGIGGGVLMSPVQFWLYTGSGMDSTLATRIAFGTSLAVMLPTMVSGALGHHKRGAVDWHAAIPMGIAAVFGGLAGGTLAAHLPGIVLRIFFAFLIIAIAIRMVWSLRECPACERQGSAGMHILLGFSIGTISGLAGIGGGALLVPALVILLGYPIHRAVGTSSACLIFSSAGAVTAYIINGIGVSGLPHYSFGYVDLLTFAILAVTTIPLARIGVRCAHNCSGRNLQILFAGLLVLIGMMMLVTG